MTREQLISLLYSILRRLLLMPQTTTAPTDPLPAGQAVDGGLVIDPTIDAWEHTGVYPQGFQPSTPRGCGSIDNLHTRPIPQFGGLTGTPGTYSHPPTEIIIASPPCTAFSRPWQPGYPMPVLPSSVGGVGSRDEDDPWAAPAEPPVLTVDQVPHSDTVTLPAALFLSQQLFSAAFLSSHPQLSSCCGQGLVASYFSMILLLLMVGGQLWTRSLKEPLRNAFGQRKRLGRVRVKGCWAAAGQSVWHSPSW